MKLIALFSLLVIGANAAQKTPGRLSAGVLIVSKGAAVLKDPETRKPLSLPAGSTTSVRAGDVVKLLRGAAYILHRDDSWEQLPIGSEVPVRRRLTERDRRLAKLRPVLDKAARDKGAPYPNASSLVPASLLTVRLPEALPGEKIRVVLRNSRDDVVAEFTAPSNSLIVLPELRRAAMVLRDAGEEFASVELISSSARRKASFRLLSRADEKRLWSSLLFPPQDSDPEIAALERRVRLVQFQLNGKRPFVDLAAALTP